MIAPIIPLVARQRAENRGWSMGSDIILTRGVRANLLALQSTADLMTVTQNRLATGKKVNTALDDPNAFFTSKALNTRASDLSALLDNIGQAIQTIKAADTGLTAMGRLLEAAKAKASQAQLSSDTFARADYLTEYNGLLDQIVDLAKDSGYNGKNLLAGSSQLTVYLNEDSTNSLVVQGFDYTDTATALGLPQLTPVSLGSISIPLVDSLSAPLTLSSPVTLDTTQFTSPGGNTITFTDANSDVIGSVTVTDTTTVSELIAQINRDFDTIRATFDNGTLTIESTETLTIGGGQGGGSFDATSLTATSSDWQTDAGISATMVSLTDAVDRLRADASSFGTNLTVVQNREAFTKSFISTLKEGSDMLVVADTNEEGANLLALQTRQQLSSTALSLAAQAEQSVLRLFG